MGALAAALLGTSAATGLLAPPAAAETTALPADLDLTQQSSAAVTVPVPAGIEPRSVTGTLTVSEPLSADVELAVGDRVAATVPGTSGPVSVPVSLADVEDDTIELTMRYGVSGSCPDGSGPAAAVLSDLALQSEGAETVSEDPEEFLPAASPRIDVVVPGRADDTLLTTGLNAVAALSLRYGPDTEVALSTSRTPRPRAGVGQRLVRLAAGDGAVRSTVSSRFGLPELTLTGGSAELLAEVRRLAGSPAGGEARTDPAPTQSLADLGVEQVELAGPTPSQTEVRVPQDAFGTTIDSLSLRATGTHSALPDDIDAQLNTYVNDTLVDSRLLDPDDTTVTVEATADASTLRAVNVVRFALSTTAVEPTTTPDPDVEGGESPAPICGRADSLPMEVYLDGEASELTASPGDDSGLGVFPAVLEEPVPVALRPTAGRRAAAAGDAAYLVSALQGAAARPLEVTVVDADEFVTGTASGLLVGADIDDAEVLAAPLRYQEFVDPQAPAPPTDVDTTRLFAAVQAISTAERDVLMLGAFGPGDRDALASLTARTARTAAERGWSSLDGDLLVATPDSEPTTMAAPVGAGGDADDGDDRGADGLWLALAVVGLVALLALQVRRSARADRSARTVEEPAVEEPTSSLESTESSGASGSRSD